MRRASLACVLSLLLPFATVPLARAQLPPPLGPPPVPGPSPITAAKAALGKALFWDEQLASSRTVACGTCHQAAVGGSDLRAVMASAHATNPGLDGIVGTGDDVAGSLGVVLRDAAGALQSAQVFGLKEQITARHSPSHINAAYAPWLFWDGRAPGMFFDPVTADLEYVVGGALENQAAAPPASAVEMGHVGRDWIDVAARVAESFPLALSTVLPAPLTTYIAGRSYPQLFAEAFGTPDVSSLRILQAIATYERTLVSDHSPFDSLLAGSATLRPDEAAGLALFQTHCASCHAGALLTDQQFHDLGLRPAAEDSGRFTFTRHPEDVRKFRTPSLRNVALRPAYMHNGRFASLAEVVEFYDRGGDFTGPNKDTLMVPLGLTPQQKAQLVAFMQRPLTDPRVAAAAPPFDQPSLFADGDLVPQVLVGGVSGSCGLPPTPVALDPAIAGNSTFAIGVYGAVGGAAAVLVVDDAVPPASQVPGTGSFARQAIVLAGAGAGGGYGSVTLAIPGDAGSYGRTLFGRWYVNDPGAAGGVAASAPFRFRIFGPHGAGVIPAALAVDAMPRVPAPLQASPNPFTSDTAVKFELSRASRLRLAVYDLNGRRVRELFERPIAMPGQYSIAWDGRNDAGRAVAAGVYFARLETEREVRMGQVVRAR